MNRTIVAALALTGCFSEAPMLTAEGTSGGDDAGTLPTLSPTAGPGTLSGSSAGPGDSGPGTGEETSEAASGSTVASASSSGSTGPEETGTDSGSTDAESSSTGPDWPHEYHDCFDGPIADGMRLCEQSCVIQEPGLSACAPDCEAGTNDCPWLKSFAATCLADVADGAAAAVCILPCDGEGAFCPVGMACETIDGFLSGGVSIWACLWE